MYKLGASSCSLAPIYTMIRRSSSAYPATSYGDLMSGRLTISTKGAPALLKSTSDTGTPPFPFLPAKPPSLCVNYLCTIFPVSSSTCARSIRTSFLSYLFKRLSGRYGTSMWPSKQSGRSY